MLMWHCSSCGQIEPVAEEDDYAEGNSEPCSFCEDGTAVVTEWPDD